MTPKNFNGRQRDKSFDRRLDQLIETGRQVVDGVAGNRPGQRDHRFVDRGTTSGLNNVGRWVEDKLDWLLEEEEEDWEDLNQEISSSGKKPFLEAISRRSSRKLTRNLLPEQNIQQENNIELTNQEWPEDSSFRIEKWERSQSSIDNTKSLNIQDLNKSKSSNLRRLPRSSRRR